MELSLVQRKLLKLLMLNCRYSNKDLAQALGVSADTVQYQIDRLISEGYIAFEFHIDCRSFGYEYYQFFIALNDPDTPVEAIAALPYVTFFGKVTGAYDYNGTFVAKNEAERAARLQAILAILKGVRACHVAKLGDEYKWTYIIEPFALAVPVLKNKKNFLYGLSKENVAIPTPISIIPADRLDFSILDALAADPRAPYVSIASKLGVSHETVRNRLRAMAENGLAMNFTAFCHFQKFGYFSYVLLLRLGEFDRKAFAQFADQKLYLQYATAFDGDFDMMIYASAKNPEEFAAYAAEIRNFFGTALESMQLLYFEKQLKNLQFPEVILHE